jgi:hypothetical protein
VAVKGGRGYFFVDRGSIDERKATYDKIWYNQWHNSMSDVEFLK